MKDIQVSTFFDTCTVDVYSESYDALGDIVKTWTAGSVIFCGVNFQPGKKRWGEEVIVDEKNVIIRLPMDTVITPQDRITVKSKSGTAMNIQCQVIGLQYGQVITVIAQRLEV